MLTAEGPIHGLGRSNSHSSSSAANLQPTSPHFQRPSIAFVSPSNAETSRPALLTPTHATSQEFGRQTSRETDALAPSYLRPSSRRMTAAAQVPQTHRASCGELVGLVGSGCGHYTGPLSCPPGHAGHGIGFGESPNAVPMPSKEQQLSAISRLRQPLSVVVQKKSLIRYTKEGRRYWRWKDVVARVLHICRGASADDYSLLLQTEHWLEACDSKHRYGSNLRPYFKAWLEADTQQSFFKWLDEGDGQHVDIAERPRKRLESERVVYCGIERCFFEVNIRNGIFQYVFSKRVVNTDSRKDGPPCPPHLSAIMATTRSTVAPRPTQDRVSVLDAAKTATGDGDCAPCTPRAAQAASTDGSSVIMASGQSGSFLDARSTSVSQPSLHGTTSVLTEQLRQPSAVKAPQPSNARHETPVTRSSLLHSRLHMSTSALLPCWRQNSNYFRRCSSGTNLGGSSISEGGYDSDDSDSDSGDDVRSVGHAYVGRREAAPLAVHSSGGWRDEDGNLHLRRLGAHSLPSGLRRHSHFSRTRVQEGSPPHFSRAHRTTVSRGEHRMTEEGCSSDTGLPGPNHHCTDCSGSGASECSHGSPRGSNHSSPASLHHRGYLSMPRVGYEDPCAYYRALRPPSRTLRFPHNPDGGAPDDSTRPPSSAVPTPSKPGTQSMPVRSLLHETDLPGRSGSGASKGGPLAGLSRLHSVSEPAEGVPTGAAPPRRIHGAWQACTESGGLSRSQRLRKSIENSHCPVIHPLLASNTAIPENLKLLDIVETIAGPSHSGRGLGSGSGGAAAAAPKDCSNGEDARKDRELAGDAVKEEPIMDLADRLEERMRCTGQLVKVKTQAELDVLLPRAPKVFDSTARTGSMSAGHAAVVSAEAEVGMSGGQQVGVSAGGSAGCGGSGGAEGVAAGRAPSKAEGSRRSVDGVVEDCRDGGAAGESKAAQGHVAKSLSQAKDGTAILEKACEKWIYVLDMHSRLYINRKMPGRFHHSSFVAGGAVKAAGSIVVEEGILKQLTTWSGHYRPRSSDIAMFLEWLEAKQVNMKDVELLLVKPQKPNSKMNQQSERRP